MFDPDKVGIDIHPSTLRLYDRVQPKLVEGGLRAGLAIACSARKPIAKIPDFSDIPTFVKPDLDI